MLTATTRLQGSSVVVTLPPKDGKNPEPNKEYIAEYFEDGTILLTPKMDDPFAAATLGEFREEEAWRNLSPKGREIL